MTSIERANLVKVHAVNLKHREDRLKSIKYEFADKAEFELHIVTAIMDAHGATGLWRTIQQVVRSAKEASCDYVVICEDDHCFTDAYTGNLNEIIKQCEKYGVDLLLGGVSWYRTAVTVTPGLVAVDLFTGLQFSVIYKNIFSEILDTKLDVHEAADIKLAGLSSRTFVIFPFISVQKEFGYSDITHSNNIKGYVSSIFDTASELMEQLVKVNKFYGALPDAVKTVRDMHIDELQIPVYIMSRQDRPSKVMAEFVGRNEFLLSFLSSEAGCTDHQYLWRSILESIKRSRENGDDIFIICDDQHRFTKHYSKETLITNIVRSAAQGGGILFGNATNLGQIVPVSHGRYWVNPVEYSSFMVVFKNIFERILAYDLQADENIFQVLSNLTSFKCLLSPFISVLPLADKPFKNQGYTMERIKFVAEAVNFWGRVSI